MGQCLCSGASLPPPPKRDAALAAGAGSGGEPKAATAAEDKPATKERQTRGEESKPPRSSDATNGAAAAPRHKDVEMKDAESAEDGRRAGSKAADKGDGGGGEQDEVTRLHVGRLTRNVKEEHVREIFSTFGKLKVRRARTQLHSRG